MLQEKLTHLELLIKAQSFNNRLNKELRPAVSEAFSKVTPEFVNLLAEMRLQFDKVLVKQYYKVVRDKQKHVAVARLYLIVIDDVLTSLENHIKTPIHQAVAIETIIKKLMYSTHYLDQLLQHQIYSVVADNISSYVSQPLHDRMYDTAHQFMSSFGLEQKFEG